AAEVGARLPAVDPPLRELRGAAPAAAHAAREADPLRRADLALDLRRRARLEPRGRPPRVPARPVARPGRPVRRDARATIRADHARVPGPTPRVAAPRRGGRERLPAGRGLPAHRRDGAPEHQLHARPALPRLLASGRAGLVVATAPSAA